MKSNYLLASEAEQQYFEELLLLETEDVSVKTLVIGELRTFVATSFDVAFDGR